MQNPDKPFKTYNEQISILKSRNVYIKNEETVKQCLTDRLLTKAYTFS